MADVFDELIILLVGGLDHSSRITGCAFHDGVMHTNMELVNEGVYLSQRVLCDLELQSVRGGMETLEVSTELALDFGKAKRGINNEKNRVEELPNRFSMTSNNFCPHAFDRAAVPERARRSGST